MYFLVILLLLLVFLAILAMSDNGNHGHRHHHHRDGKLHCPLWMIGNPYVVSIVLVVVIAMCVAGWDVWKRRSMGCIITPIHRDNSTSLNDTQSQNQSKKSVTQEPGASDADSKQSG